LSDAKNRENEATGSDESETWAGVFSALDAAGVSDGIAVERDVRPAEERLTLDAFFAGGSGAEEVSQSDLVD
jgi:hypothetical protein